MPDYDDSPRTLPADRAFVVHFAGPGRPGRFAGRVEHLASGTATQFRSLRALLAFFARVLAAPEETT